eukprot:6181160-Pleurochrysis_carterae.AAC.6
MFRFGPWWLHRHAADGRLDARQHPDLLHIPLRVPLLPALHDVLHALTLLGVGGVVVVGVAVAVGVAVEAERTPRLCARRREVPEPDPPVSADAGKVARNHTRGTKREQARPIALE